MELVGLRNSVIIFLLKMNLLRWLTFLLAFLIVTLTVLLFWISFFLLMVVFFLQWLSLNWKILIMLLSQFLLAFCQTQNRMPRFIAYDCSRADWGSLCDHLRDVPLEDIFKLYASAAASGIDLYPSF